MVTAARSFTLNTNAQIPSVGLGTWKADPGLISDVLAKAIKVGYRHIDCAQVYGNEKEIGLALKKLLQDGAVKREDLWITSKLWCTDHDAEDVRKAMDRTLSDLQLEYVDLYLIHWPVRMKTGSGKTVGFKPECLCIPDIPSTWKAMEALYDSRKARNIGVSNFSCKKLADLLLVSRVPPAVNQVECHPLWHQAKLREFCRSKGIHMSGYAPLGGSFSETKRGNEVIHHPVLKKVAEELGKSPAQVAIRWGLQMCHSVLPKSTNEARIKENLDVFDWCIPADAMEKLSSLEQRRIITGVVFVSDTFGPYRNVEDLWDGES